MSGEVKIENSGLFGGTDVVVTMSRLNDLVVGMVANIVAGSVTERELADGSIPLSKLQADMAGVGLKKNQVTNRLDVDLDYEALSINNSKLTLNGGGVLESHLRGNIVSRDKLGVSAMPQVVYQQFSNVFSADSTHNNVWRDIETSGQSLSADITPRKNTHKVLVTGCVPVYFKDALECMVAIRLLRNGSVVEAATAGTIIKGLAAATNQGPGWYMLNFCVLDSPASAESVTYKVQIMRYSGGLTASEFDVNTGGSGVEGMVSTMVLQEVFAPTILEL